MSQDQSSTPNCAAERLMEFSRMDGVLAIRGLQAALIDAAIALDDARTKSLRSAEGTSAIAPSWAFVEAALLKEYERMDYAQGMFPQVRDEIKASRRNLLDAVDTVRYAKERGMPLPTAEEVAKCGATDSRNNK